MSRYRQQDDRNPSVYTIQDFNPGSSSPSSVTIEDSGRKKSGTFKSISDIVTGGYNKRRRKGEIILNPVTIKSEKRDCVDSHWTFGEHPVWGRRLFDGSVACEWHTPPSGMVGYDADVTLAKDLALIRAYANMNSPDVLSSVFYAERGKTLESVRHPLKAANDLLESIFSRRGSFVSRGMNVAKATANAWLELRFGWRPLMYDILGFVKASHDSQPPSGTVLVARGGQPPRVFKSHGLTSLVSPAGLTDAETEYDWSISTKVSAGVVYTLADLSQAAYKARCLGLNLSSVPAHVWEVIPFSFVVDWFVKVGDWLYATTPNPDVSVKGNWVSTKRVEDNSTVILNAHVHVNNSPATDYFQSGGSYQEHLEVFTREINRSIPSVPPMAGIPLSFSQQLDSAALIYQQVMKAFGKLRL